MFRRLNVFRCRNCIPENFTRTHKNVRFCSKKSEDSNSQTSHSGNYEPPGPENPFSRTFRVLGNDMKTLKHGVENFFSKVNIAREAAKKETKNAYFNEVFPEHCDIVVIGGGVMGSSIAYFLKQRVPEAITVTVIEKDPSVNDNPLSWGQYATASTCLSVGGLRQQFSLEENIKMSLFGADFLRDIKQYLGVDGHDPPDVCFQPCGYLFMATEKGAEQLKENSELQNKLGARNVLLSPSKLKEKFPWLNTDGIALGCHGLEKEGWFDPWSLLIAFKKKAISVGVEYVNGEAVGFQFKKMPDILMEGVEPGCFEALDKVVVKMADGEIRAIKFAIAILAGGSNSGEIAKLARIGTGNGLLSIPLPVEPRKRYVYCFNCKDGPGLNTPLAIDPSGTYFRREGFGGNFICGRSPEFDEEPNTDNLEVDYDFFNSHIWPVLANRVPAFESLKVNNAWAGYYEYNTFDENGIIGPHPYYTNLYFATGFSGHGIQQAPAVGRAIMELILDGGFQTIDLSRMCFDRLITDMPIREQNCW